MSDNAENEEHSSTEGEARETQEKVSPAELWDGSSEYFNMIWQDLYKARTVQRYRDALANLVFHARHLRPEDHAELSQWILKPVTQQRGRPKNDELHEMADDLYMFPIENEPGKSQKLVSTFGVSKENARGALLAAKRRKAARRGEE